MHRHQHSRPGRRKGYFISLAVVFVWLLAGLHVTLQHSIDDGNLAPQEQCQLCRINHLAAADLKAPALITPPLVSGPLVVMAAVSHPKQRLPGTWQARAPPLT